MPIQAAANKLKRELESGIVEQLAQRSAAAAAAAGGAEEAAEAVVEEAPAAEAAAAAPAPDAAAPGGGAPEKERELGKFVGKKTKAVAKGTAGAPMST
jgi:hypothetical protein